jgi:deoxycytidylate deaminase
VAIQFSIINDLFEKAKTIDRVAGAKLSAAIVYRNDVIAIATNTTKTHPLQKKYGKNDNSVCLHAEIHAVVKALKIIDRSDFAQCELYIARARQTGRKSDYIWGSAAPCEGCIRMINDMNIKQTIFTTDETGVIDTL